MNQPSTEELLKLNPYELSIEEKNKLFTKAMGESFKHHFNNCELFKNFCINQNFSPDDEIKNLGNLPYLPINIFKKKNLSSLPKEEILLTLNSSATSGMPSSISIDSVTSRRQTLVSAKIMTNYLGSERRPFIILDEDPKKAKSAEISARSAATRGFLVFAKSADYFLNSNEGNLSLDIEKLISTLNKYESENIEVCIFGFTFVLYNNFIKELKNKGLSFKLPVKSKVVHIGGWKKLESQKVDKETFLNDVSELLGINKNDIIDFYGFTEQMGITYANCGLSPKITPIYSEIIIRDFQTLEPTEDGKEGLIQFLTPIPYSYPGISVLTEDVGRIIGRGKDANGRIGVQFEMVGRAKKAEARGCGDILAEIVQ